MIFDSFDLIQCDEVSACTSFADKCGGECPDCRAFAADMDAMHAAEALELANMELLEVGLTELELCV